MIGTRVVRNEDPELLTTGGRFVDVAPIHPEPQPPSGTPGAMGART